MIQVFLAIVLKAVKISIFLLKARLEYKGWILEPGAVTSEPHLDQHCEQLLRTHQAPDLEQSRRPV